MKLSIEELKDLSARLKFNMSEYEYSTLQEEFEVLLAQMELIGEIKETEMVEPMTFPFLYSTNGLREDEIEEVISTEEALKNAKEVLDGQFKIKKVVG